MKETADLPEMKYVSTRGAVPPLNFEETLLAGLAGDGGLFLPRKWPRLKRRQFEQLRGRPYGEVVLEVLRPFTGGTFDRAELRGLISDSYARFRHPAKCPLTQLAPDLHLLELFHGPTLAFKDFALQLVGRMFAHVLRRKGRRVTIIGATSGDTGSAAIEAFRGLEAADVFILYPHGRVSEIQRRQMTTPSESNVHAIAVEGDFDDCQALVKDMFNDEGFRRRFNLGAVNSINWARIAVQAAYFVASALALGAPRRGVSFVVPTGNFGDIFSGYAAMKLGLPVERLVVAANQNDILHRALSSGKYRTGQVRPSISPSMDIQISSNFERALFEAGGRDSARLSPLMRQAAAGGFEIPEDTLRNLRSVYASGCASEEETRQCIADVRRQAGQLVCPHSAVGIKVAKDLEGDILGPVISLATAHPAKFPEAVEAATGIHPSLPNGMDALFRLEERVTSAPASLAAIQSIIHERTAA